MGLIQKGDLVMFQGDSVTAGGRKVPGVGPMGRGYPMHIAARYIARYPNSGVRFENWARPGTGITQMAEKWEETCISRMPNVVSIQIGLNNASGLMDRKEFAAEYRKLLVRLREATDAKIVLMDAVCYIAPYRKDWNDPHGSGTRAENVIAMDECYNGYIPEIQNLAEEFAAVYVPVHALFKQAIVRAPKEIWSNDGVHPTDAGHWLIADAWLKAVEDWQ